MLRRKRERNRGGVGLDAGKRESERVSEKERKTGISEEKVTLREAWRKGDIRTIPPIGLLVAVSVAPSDGACAKQTLASGLLKGPENH